MQLFHIGTFLLVIRLTTTAWNLLSAMQLYTCSVLDHIVQHTKCMIVSVRELPSDAVAGNHPEATKTFRCLRHRFHHNNSLHLAPEINLTGGTSSIFSDNLRLDLSATNSDDFEHLIRPISTRSKFRSLTAADQHFYFQGHGNTRPNIILKSNKPAQNFP